MPESGDNTQRGDLQPIVGVRLGSLTARLRATFLAPVAIVIAAMAALLVAQLFVYEREAVEYEVTRVRTTLDRTYQEELANNRALLHAVMDVIQLDPGLYRALGRKDRAELMARVAPSFPNLQKKFHISQFYFAGPDRKNLLRVHQPGVYGDVISRYTMLEAERTGVMARGVELDPEGVLALHMVHPWYLEPPWFPEPGQHLIGYFELGMDIDHILRAVQDFLGVQVVVLVSKRHLERASWEAGMRALGREPEWDRFPETVMSYQATHTLAPAIVAALAGFPAPAPDAVIAATHGRESYRLTAVPLGDAAGRTVAWMVAAVDVSRHAAAARRAVWVGSGFALVAGGALFTFFWRLVGRVGRRLERDEQALVRFRASMEATADCLLLIEPQTLRIVDFNRMAVSTLGYTPEELLAMGPQDLAIGKTRNDFVQLFADLAHGPPEGVTLEALCRHKDGTDHPVETSFTLFAPPGAAPLVIALARDITVRKRAEAEKDQLMKRLDELASHDGLTGLYNHRTFYRLLEDELTRAKRFNRPVSLLMIDIDHFKHVNDTHGHQAGDAILRGLGNLLTRQARAIDRVCRYGGEEITVILPETENAAALNIAERLRTVVEQEPFDIGNGRTVRITVSIGLASWPSQAATGEELVTAADTALYAAKQGGRNRVCRYEPAMRVSGG